MRRKILLRKCVKSVDIFAGMSIIKVGKEGDPLMKIWFDMDGTIADLYAITDWLPSIIARDTRPYEIAKGIGNLALIARLLNAVQKNGHEIGIISWGAKNAENWYNEAVATAKHEWLAKHLKSVKWNEIKVVAYGTDKKVATGGGILFDDEKPNRDNWGKGAYEPAEIIAVLKGLTK